jgi:hypothetical protein
MSMTLARATEIWNFREGVKMPTPAEMAELAGLAVKLLQAREKTKARVEKARGKPAGTETPVEATLGWHGKKPAKAGKAAQKGRKGAKINAGTMAAIVEGAAGRARKVTALIEQDARKLK